MKGGSGENLQGFSPSWDHSLKIEAEQSSVRFLFLRACPQKRRQLVKKPTNGRFFDKLWLIFSPFHTLTFPLNKPFSTFSTEFSTKKSVKYSWNLDFSTLSTGKPVENSLFTDCKTVLYYSSFSFRIIQSVDSAKSFYDPIDFIFVINCFFDFLHSKKINPWNLILSKLIKTSVKKQGKKIQA